MNIKYPEHVKTLDERLIYLDGYLAGLNFAQSIVDNRQAPLTAKIYPAADGGEDIEFGSAFLRAQAG